MVDVVDKETRSRMMSGIRGKNTIPEITIRKGLHAKGFRFRLHVSNLPGRPDIVLPKFGAVVFVQGCFWHRHQCHLFKWPSTNTVFWRCKINRNATIDASNLTSLCELGWRVLYVWECALKGPDRREPEKLVDLIAAWVKSSSQFREIAGGRRVDKKRRMN